jgi:hypothetical protein
MITQPAVPVTGTASTNTVVNTTGNTAYVTVNANGATMSNYYVNGTSVATTAAAYMATLTPGSYISLAYTVAVPVWYWSPFTPALPATTVAAVNTTGKSLGVVFVGGTITAVTVNGATANVPQTGGSVALPPAGSIAVTYTGTPYWAWMDWLDLAPLPNSNGTAYAQANTVAPTGTAGYSELNTLAYAAHATGGMPGWAAGVAN